MKPENEAELAEMILNARGGLRVRGGGTRPIGHQIDGARLETGGLSGIRLYEPGALTMVAGAGTPLAEIETALAEEGQRLAFEPGDWRGLLGTEGSPTLGGVVATNASGPRRVQLGAARDFMLGVRFVDGAGQIVKNGGRVMKNVTGYDLVKLLCGSWGTLGVLTEVSFKVQAKPEAEATLRFEGLQAKAGVAALSTALATPFEVSGAAHLEGQTMVRVEGLSGSVTYRAKRLQQDVLQGFEVVEGIESAQLWRQVRDITPFAGQNGAVWRVSVKPTDGPVLSEALSAGGLQHQAIYDWGGGLIWVLIADQPDAGAALLRQKVVTLGGHATLFRRSEAIDKNVPTFQPQPAPLAAIEAGLRARFDPKGILNPGLMG